MIQYPDSIPLDEIKSVVEIARTGNFSGHMPELMHNIWVIQGYGQKMLFGTANNSLLLSQSAEETDGLAVLEKVVAQSATSEPTAQLSIPWNVVLPWLLKLAITALEAA